MQTMRAAFFDIGAIFKEGGEIIDPKDWPADIRKVVSGIKVIPQLLANGELGYAYDIKFPDRLKALQMLFEYQGINRAPEERIAGEAIVDAHKTEEEVETDSRDTLRRVLMGMQLAARSRDTLPAPEEEKRH